MTKITSWNTANLVEEIIKADKKKHKILTIIKHIQDFYDVRCENYRNHGIEKGKEEKLKELREFLGIKRTSFSIHEIPKHIDLTKTEDY